MKGGKRMPDNIRRERSFGILDSMTTAELEDLMRQMPLEDIDTDYWNAVMDAYMSRADVSKSDVEAALNDFKEKYSGYEPVFCESSETPRKTQASQKVISRTGHRSLFRAGFVAAIVAVMLIAGTVTAYAFGYDLWGAVATWTKDVFSFAVDDEEPTSAVSPNNELYELHLAILDAGITQEVAPTWLPEDYKAKDLDVSIEPFKLFAAFSKDNGSVIIQIRDIDSSNSTFEKDAGDVEEYIVNGITHYIISNNNQPQAVWVNADLECSISGDISKSEMQRMIQSIYKES
jgi:hypothetical protein